MANNKATAAMAAEEDDDAAPASRVESLLAGLRPIQDLAKNWDIDIASCLEEYLNDLVGGMVLDGHDLSLHDGHNVSVDGISRSTTKTNFAKAALVLHNSSHVYSRKVEYLHNLVLSALERMSKTTAQAAERNTNKRGGSSTDKHGRGDDVDEFWEFDPHQNFLLLDDVLPVDKTPDCRHINLATTPEEVELNRRLTISRDITMLTPGGRRRRSSSMTKTLGASTTLQNVTSGAASPINALAWIASNLANGNGGATSGALRLMNGVCELDPETGRLILPGSQTRSGNTEHALRSSLSGISSIQDASNSRDNNFAHVRDLGEDGGGYYDDGGGGGGGDDEDNDGPGFVMAETENSGENSTPVIAHSHATTTAADSTTDSRQVRFAPNKSDPWALLDPHEPMTSSTWSKPLRLGKTVRLPESLQQTTANKKRGRTSDDRRRPPPRYIAVEQFRHISDPNSHPPPDISWEGLTYGDEFADLLRQTLSLRNAEKRRQRNQESLIQLRVTSEEQEEEEERENVYDQGEDDGYLADDWGGGGGDDDDHGVDANGNHPIETNTGLTSVDQIYRDTDNDESDSRADARTFEDLCRAHIAAFSRGAEKYAASTNLTQRVDQWQERITPILNEEEERPIFDIYTYGNHVIQRLQEELEVDDDHDGSSCSSSTTEKNRVVDFAKVVQGKTQYDVCRLFLACLSLCNSGNVVLKSGTLPEGQSGGVPPVMVELLSAAIERPMETYLAPSAGEPHGT